jgi:ADP-dependent NAD(P)H-hydrate dehydratase / NAD(P)H-hydrate epimerase
MLPVLTAVDTHALDRKTEARGTTVVTLMERAGFAVARAAVAAAGGVYGRRAVVACGKGNNGGDGLVAARHLDRWGVAVEVFLLAEPTSGAPSVMRDRLQGAGVRVQEFDRPAFGRALDRADVVVDAIFGTGFRGQVGGLHADVIGAINQAWAAVIAVDIPSGVEGDTGAIRGPAVAADVTVTFGAPKAGALLYPGADHAGVVEVADIGFPEDLLRPGDLTLVEPEDVRAWLPVRPPDTHKRRTGVVLVVAGSRRMTGAPRLVAEGAFRTGAGLVTVALPAGILPVVQATTTEATFLPIPEGPAGSVVEAGWDELAERLDAFDALAIGPGLTTDEETPEFVRRMVRQSSVPVVVDADALNAFAGRAGDLGLRRAPAILTPHTGEFARLFGMPAAEVLEDRPGLARKAAAETGCVVVLKGARTVVALPEGQVRVNPTGSPALATGGTGDVLTGAVAALLARGAAPPEAASAAAYIHGLAGEIAAARTGEGTVASEVARALPEAVRRVEGPA